MQTNCWHIRCNHTPETIDRIMMAFRKRGMTVNTFRYQKESETTASSFVEFDLDEENATRVYNNLIRIVDILEIEILTAVS
jgi:acetolactate synthase II small subunit